MMNRMAATGKRYRTKLTVKRYPDNCYAVVRGNRRGPVGPDRRRAVARYRKSGLIAYAGSDKP